MKDRRDGRGQIDNVCMSECGRECGRVIACVCGHERVCVLRCLPVYLCLSVSMSMPVAVAIACVCVYILCVPQLEQFSPLPLTYPCSLDCCLQGPHHFLVIFSYSSLAFAFNPPSISFTTKANVVLKWLRRTQPLTTEVPPSSFGSLKQHLHSFQGWLECTLDTDEEEL